MGTQETWMSDAAATIEANKDSINAPRVARECRNCVHFRNDGRYLERVFQGLNTMSSGDASVRAEDGVCLRHDRYLSARASCGDFAAAYSNP
jgi:hypothetical protein